MRIRKSASAPDHGVKLSSAPVKNVGKLINPGKIVFADAEMLRQRAALLNPMGAISQELARFSHSPAAAPDAGSAWVAVRNTQTDPTVDVELWRERAATLSPLAEISALIAKS